MLTFLFIYKISIAHLYFSTSCYLRNILFRFSGKGKLLNK